uniref:Uncharacterized protein n=1 Tax=Rhizophora mucronata TaxID=61149 RepID=A0A2P2QYC6_RHIMU
MGFNCLINSLCKLCFAYASLSMNYKQ